MGLVKDCRLLVCSGRCRFLLLFLLNQALDLDKIHIVVPPAIPLPSLHRPGDLHPVTDVVEADIIDIIPGDLENLLEY